MKSYSDVTMTDKEFSIELIRRLQDVDDTCTTCIYNPKHDICTNIEVGDIETCYIGIKAFMERKKNETSKD